MPGKRKTYRLSIDETLCKGCRLCIDFCPNGVLDLSVELNAGGTPFAKTAHAEKCTGCKTCTLVCPDACIELSEQEDA